MRTSGEGWQREDVSFSSGGERCAAWLYRPDAPGGDGARHPLIVMAHGFCGVREARLWAYAERFTEAGYGVLLFDYRHFGASSGEPRELLSIGRQLEDWRAAIAWARVLPGVDRERIVLWGTSFSGGHVVEVASGDDRIAAVISQAPFSDGLSVALAMGPVGGLKLTAASLRDVGRALTGREPARVPAVARPGETAAMSQEGALEGYNALFEDPAEFRPNFAPRRALRFTFYGPARKAGRLACPLLVLTCGDDTVTPAEPARKMAERAPLGEHIRYEGAGHFDIYVGELFERTIADQIAFLDRAVAARSEAEPASGGVEAAGALDASA